MIQVTAAELVELADADDVRLGAGGIPNIPLVAVGLEGPADPRLIAAAAQVAERLGVVCLGVARTDVDTGWGPLMDALTCTLVEGVAVSPTTVAVSDVECELAVIDKSVRQNMRAALTLVRVLRATSRLDVPDALAVESAAYSMLLAGPEFGAWRASRAVGHRPKIDSPAVLLSREGGVLSITLNRAGRHNAFDIEIRDGLVEGLDLALRDESIERIVLSGAGASFCSGGDLDEFGTAPDVATAHLIRLERSVAARIHRARARTRVRLHGACIGAGIEFPSFAGRVEAREDAFFQLPELSMGLIPGAGGTVGISRRVGRWRTAYLCLSGTRLTVGRALDWNLVDERAPA